jgi:hypothetical protein
LKAKQQQRNMYLNAGIDLTQLNQLNNTTMAKANYVQISSWMKCNINEHIDHMTGEVCVTDLAEAAAEHFKDNDLVIPERYYNIAVDVEASLLGNSYDHGF